MPDQTRFRHLQIAALLSAILLAPTLARAQSPRAVVVDQTGLPLPGVRIDVHRGDQLTQSVVTEGDGTFELTPGQPDDVVEATLEGFETTRVSRADALRIVMLLARTNEVTNVVASALTSSGSSMERLGSTMTAPLAQRLPTPRPRILQSLPLLPSVVRGRDGQLRIGGTRPHESTLWVDGFDVTDPVTGTTAIDLPNESVKGMAVVREPISATFRRVLGSMASIETTAGTGEFRLGVQGFIPRPRLNSQYGLGRIEAFFPRAYVGGRAGIARYFTSFEVNFERVPIPGVTSQSGSPASGSTGVVSFSRVDFDLSPRNTLTLEGMFLPAMTSYAGLSPLQQPEAAPDLRALDVFGGIVDRIVLRPSELLTFRIGVLNHQTEIGAAGVGDSILRPDGWHQNWFSAVDTSGTRPSASVTWDKAGISARGVHTFSLSGDVQSRTMSSAISHQSIEIRDDLDRLMRQIDFAPLSARVATDDVGVGAGFRDLWDLNQHLQLDLDFRLDWDRGASSAAPSPRLGLRYAFDENDRTTIKASVGRFVGLVPLGALAFAQFPARTDSSFDPAIGALLSATTIQPSTRTLDLPRADGAALELEHRIRPGLEAQAAVRVRHGSHLPTVSVAPATGGALLESTGESLYREFQISVRQTWSGDTQLFVSYVHSSSQSDLNDFGSLFTNLDTPFLEPGGTITTTADVPDRLRAWGTVSLPRRVVVSPAVDWRTGFPYSRLDEYRHYVGTPNSERFPTYFAMDLTAFKTFDLFGRKMDLGLQVFNLTDHFNPRDVISVVQSPRFGELTNNPGITFGGYMQIRW
jgi:hypothetical protein